MTSIQRLRRQPYAREAALLLLPLTAACANVVPQPASAPPPQPRPPAHAVPPTRPAPPPAQGFRAPQVQQGAGLERVIDKDAATLVREFGKPRLDVREGDMRKLQFAGEPCVLDVYLYPLRPGAAPVATYLDARRTSDGLDVDRAACIAALAR